MTEDQIDDGEIEDEDDVLSYNSEIDSLTSEIEDGLLNMEEESEVIANLDGTTPTWNPWFVLPAPAVGDLSVGTDDTNNTIYSSAGTDAILTPVTDVKAGLMTPGMMKALVVM